MASPINNMLSVSVLESSQKAPDLGQAISRGAELAQTIEGMKTQRANVEQQKQALQMQKANSITDTMKIAAESKDPRMKKYLMTKVLPAKVNALGMNEFFTPQTLEMLQVSDEAMKKVLGLQLDLDEKVRSGQLTGAQAYAEAQRVLSDPEELALLDTDQLFDAQKFKNSEEGKSARVAQQAAASMGKQIQGQVAAPIVDEQKKLRDDLIKFESQGGKAAAEAKLKKMKDAVDYFAELKKTKSGTGTVGAAITSRTGTMGIFSPKLKSAQDALRSSINLKDSLDSQFAAKEAEQQYSQRTVDADLPPEMNYERAKAMYDEAKTAYQNKIRIFKSKGIVNGPAEGDTKEWQGQTFKVINGQWVKQ